MPLLRQRCFFLLYAKEFTTKELDSGRCDRVIVQPDGKWRDVELKVFIKTSFIRIWPVLAKLSQFATAWDATKVCFKAPSEYMKVLF